MPVLIWAIVGFSRDASTLETANLRLSEKISSFERAINDLEAAQKERAAAIDARLVEVFKANDSQPLSLELKYLRAEVKQLAARIGVLETGIGQSPEKQLALPLLQKDLQSIQSEMKLVSSTFSKQLDTATSGYQWLIVTFLALAGTNLWAVLRKP